MILVINLGLKSIRAIIFDREGRKLASASQPVQTLLDGVRVEQDPEEWWELIGKVADEALADRGLGKRLEAVTVTGSSSCLVPIDSAMRPTGPAIMVSDSRDLGERAELAAAGIPVRQVPMLPRVMWLRKNGNGTWPRTRWLAGVNSYVIARLTGRVCTDPLNAEKIGWQPETGAWDRAALAAAEVDEGMLPGVLPLGAAAGPLTDEARRHLHITGSRDIQCCLTSYDAICALFGSGVSADGEACDISGTVTSLRAVSRTRPAGPGGEVFVQQESTHGFWIVGGSNNLGGGIIEWARQTFYADDKYPYEAMTTEAESCPPGSEGLVFLPYLLGERAPLWDTDLRGVFFGLERHHSRKHLIRAVFESTALGLVPLKEAIEKHTGPLRSISASGGMSRISLINQIKADVLQTEVRVLDEFESTAFGAYVLAATALGVYPDLAEAQRLVQVRQIVMPRTRKAPLYRELASFYKDLLAGMRPFFTRRREQLLPALPLDVSVVGNL